MTATTRIAELQNIFDSLTRAQILVALNKIEGTYNAGLAVYDATQQHRVFTMATICKTANRQGFNLTPCTAQAQYGRLCHALAEALGLTAELEEIAALYGEGVTYQVLTSWPVGGGTLDTCLRDESGDMVWALRLGLCS